MEVSKQSLGQDSSKFTEFMRRLVSVPHSEIKQKLDAEREAKQVASRASASSSTER